MEAAVFMFAGSLTVVYHELALSISLGMAIVFQLKLRYFQEYYWLRPEYRRGVPSTY